MNGAESLLPVMAVSIHAEWQFLIKNGLDCKIQHTILDPMGRYIILKADIKDSRYVLINLYAPNKDKDQVEFINNLLAILRKESLDTEEKRNHRRRF